MICGSRIGELRSLLRDKINAGQDDLRAKVATICDRRNSPIGGGAGGDIGLGGGYAQAEDKNFRMVKIRPSHEWNGLDP